MNSGGCIREIVSLSLSRACSDSRRTTVFSRQLGAKKCEIDKVFNEFIKASVFFSTIIFLENYTRNATAYTLQNTLFNIIIIYVHAYENIHTYALRRRPNRYTLLALHIKYARADTIIIDFRFFACDSQQTCQNNV